MPRRGSVQEHHSPGGSRGQRTQNGEGLFSGSGVRGEWQQLPPWLPPLSGWVMGRTDSSDNVGPAKGAHSVPPPKVLYRQDARCQGACFGPCSSRCWEDYQKDLSLFN